MQDFLRATKERPVSGRNLLRDFATYLGISVVFAALLFGGLFLGDEWTAFLHWFWFLVYTGAIFGIYLHQGRTRWQRRGFWYGSAVLLLLHLLIFLFLQHRGLTEHSQQLGQYVGIEGLILAAISWEYKSPAEPPS